MVTLAILVIFLSELVATSESRSLDDSKNNGNNEEVTQFRIQTPLASLSSFLSMLFPRVNLNTLGQSRQSAYMNNLNSM
jgi:hypothetical protein